MCVCNPQVSEGKSEGQMETERGMERDCSSGRKGTKEVAKNGASEEGSNRRRERASSELAGLRV